MDDEYVGTQRYHFTDREYARLLIARGRYQADELHERGPVKRAPAPGMSLETRLEIVLTDSLDLI